MPDSNDTAEGLALTSSESLAYNSTIDVATQFDAFSYLVHFQSTLGCHALQKKAIDKDALYAPYHSWLCVLMPCCFQLSVLPGAAVLPSAAQTARQARFRIRR